MKKIISLFLTLALLVGCTLIFASCGEPKDDGAEISVYLGEFVYDFDPTDYYVGSNAEQMLSLLFDPLFAVNEKGKLKLDGAADSYDVDKEDRKIVIELKETYWSDGVRVKAEDYVHAWRDILLEPNNANPASVLLFDIENAAEIKRGEVPVSDFGAVASETYQITITYREGADYDMLLKNLASIATSPIRQDIVTTINSGYWSKFINTAVTNGAFMIGSIDHDANSFTLVRNTGYHQERDVKDTTKVVRPAKLISFITPTVDEAALTYDDIENKTVFYMGDASLAMRAENKDDAMVADDLSTYSYVFNMDNPLFKIEKVRQALSMAIDRNSVIEAITFGKAATGFLPPAVLDVDTGKTFTTEELISKSAGVDAAKALLADVDFTGIDRTFTLTVNADEESKKIAEIVSAAWAAIGFTVKVEAVGTVENVVPSDEESSSDKDSKETFKDSEIQVIVNKASRGERDFDVIAVDWQMYSTDPFVALAAFSQNFSGCGAKLPDGDFLYGSFGGYANAEYDALIEAAYNETDSEKRSEILHEAEEMLVNSACIVPIVFNESFAFVSDDLSKIKFDGFGNFVLVDTKQKNYRDYLD